MSRLFNHMPTADLQAIDAAHHLHPFTNGDELNEIGARIITRAKGCYLTDSEGVEILDGMAGLWCVNIGYGRDELAQAAYDQMKELPYYNTFFKTSHPPVIELGRKLAEILPGEINHVFFASGGSDANDTNIRIARHYWALKGKPGKKTIISRKNGYHGSTMGSASLGGMKPMHSQGGLPIADITHIDQPFWWAEGGDMSPEEFGVARARALEAEIERLGEDNVAAFIAEPVQGAGGVIVPPATYWPEIQRICDKYEILLIADEVICGFGRTGNWFGSETYSIRPDIMTIAKGLSSGYVPIGGSAVSDEVASTLNSDDFHHGYTYSGHPVSCSVALENLRILQEEGVVDRVGRETAPYLREKWEALADHPLVGEARISGMMAAIQLSPDRGSRAGFTDLGQVGGICRDFSFANALVMRNTYDAMVISPPLVITKDEIDLLIERAVKSLDQTLAALKRDGLFKPA